MEIILENQAIIKIIQPFVYFLLSHSKIHFSLLISASKTDDEYEKPKLATPAELGTYTTFFIQHLFEQN